MYYLFLLAVLGFSVLSSVAGEDSELCRSNKNGTALNRQKRMASCKKWREWQCLDGTCIPIESKCDGVVDCSDRSDEIHAICRNTQCQENWFRCTYGACVDGTAACNGKQECADNSDELLPRCRNETQEFSRDFKCLNGEVIPSTNRCDGVEDCSDKSDEILATCAGTYCASPYFQCAYGACVDHGSDCDGKVNCADDSDEDDVLCNRTLSTKPNMSKNPKHSIMGNEDPSKRCTLPPYPKNGSYVADGISTKPGESFGNGYINFTCNEGYRLVGRRSVACFNGDWQNKFPKCGRFCKIVNKVNVRYECMSEGDSEGTRKCREYEPVGTQVNHHCNTNYRPDGAQLGFMVCKEDGWANVPRCIPECGKVTPSAVALIMGGWMAEKGELPWHTGIYLKEILKETNELHYKNICGGSLVTTSVVLSAAHCFWGSNQLEPAKNYAVALGKLYSEWENNEHDVQKSDVKEIHVSPLYKGIQDLYQADIAVLLLQKSIVYQLHIRPVCMDFEQKLTNEQLQPGNMAKVAGWGLVSEMGHNSSEKLKVVDLPYVDSVTCLKNSKEQFKPFVTEDKFCAGYANGTALCQGDSGGGLVFPDQHSGRYYLRGIVSTAHATDQKSCDSKSLTTFTNIQDYELFIKMYLQGDDF